jgi:hypothetical protein
MRLAELEGLISTALETRNAKLEQVRDWLSEADRLHEDMRISGFPLFDKKKAFSDDDLVARLGTPEQQLAREQRLSVAHSEKDAIDLKRAQLYEIERLSHPKLEQPPKCIYPERLHCDYYDELTRCEHMEYGGRPGFWHCTAGQKSG